MQKILKTFLIGATAALSLYMGTSMGQQLAINLQEATATCTGGVAPPSGGAQAITGNVIANATYYQPSGAIPPNPAVPVTNGWTVKYNDVTSSTTGTLIYAYQKDTTSNCTITINGTAFSVKANNKANCAKSGNTVCMFWMGG